MDSFIAGYSPANAEQLAGGLNGKGLVMVSTTVAISAAGVASMTMPPSAIAAVIIITPAVISSVAESEGDRWSPISRIRIIITVVWVVVRIGHTR